jgi:nitrogen fixation protein NifU and related proteins
MAELNQRLLNHFLNPQNVGVIENPDGYGQSLNPINQYITEVYLRIKDGIIAECRFKSYGCVVTIAVASALTVVVKNRPVRYFTAPGSMSLVIDLIQDEVGGVPAENWHCPPTATQAFYHALHDYMTKSKNKEQETVIDTILHEVQCYFDEHIEKNP